MQLQLAPRSDAARAASYGRRYLEWNLEIRVLRSAQLDRFDRIVIVHRFLRSIGSDDRLDNVFGLLIGLPPFDRVQE